MIVVRPACSLMVPWCAATRRRAPALRDAVPSFRERWAETTAEIWYHPKPTNEDTLVSHLVERAARGDWTEYADFCAALERLYAELSPEDADVLLTAGVLWYLIHGAEDSGLELFTLYKPLGPRSREGWRAAYEHTHGGREYIARPGAQRAPASDKEA
jgi:hypothetical protein